MYDAFGNRLSIETTEKGVLNVTVGDSPIYVTGPAVTKVLSHRPVEQKAAEGKVVVDFDKPGQLNEAKEPSKVLESTWYQPRVKGDFRWELVTEDGASALKAELKPDKDDRKLLPRYLELALAQPIELTGRPGTFTARVKGNGGWGRIMFEMQDAKGRIWTSSGSQHSGAPNSGDCRGDSFLSFDGWGTIRVPLPGQYPGKDQHVIWPANHEWWPTNNPPDEAKLKAREEAQAAKAVGKKMTRAEQTRLEETGEEPVDYPLKLTKIILEVRPEVLYVDEQRPVTSPVIYVDRVSVIEAAEGR